jgi:lipoprotein-releasing system permease protein
MMRPIAVFVGLRYLRTQHGNQFASFVSLASAVGVALGVAALIVVLSVMNGFANELRSRLTSLTGHGWVGAPQGLADWRRVRASLLAFPGIQSATPVVELESVISNGSELAPAIVTGLAPGFEGPDSPLVAAMRVGRVEALVAGGQRMLLGEGLAARLGVRPGDQVTVLIPRKDPALGLQTRLRRFTVAGIFELGVKDHDSVRAIVELGDATALAGLGERVSGMRVTTTDIFAAPTTLRAWHSAWSRQGGAAVTVRDWTQDHATYFRAVRLERVMMIILLSLIVGVAAFNIVATLVMVVTDKRPGIAILRTFGYGRGEIVRIFAVQGLVVGWVGVLVGTCAGVLLANQVDRLAPVLERLFGFQFMPADVYYLTSLPSELHWADVAIVSLIALLLTAMATIYPAFRAAAVQPAEVLRYE